MSRIAAVILLVVVYLPGAVTAVGASPDSSDTREVEFTLSHVEAADVLVALRAIAGTSQIEILENRVVKVTDTPENLKIAEQVIGMLDLSSSSEGDVVFYSVPSGDAVIVRFRLRRSTPGAVMSVLRNVLSIGNVAVSTEPALIIIRDTQERTSAAQELVRIMEEPCSCSADQSGT